MSLGLARVRGGFTPARRLRARSRRIMRLGTATQRTSLQARIAAVEWVAGAVLETRTRHPVRTARPRDLDEERMRFAQTWRLPAQRGSAPADPASEPCGPIDCGFT